MQFTVVGKIILGFAVFAMLMLFTTLTSYLGLSDIRDSAERVVEEKMPVQSRMMAIQTQILSLGKLTLQGYYLESLPALARNKGEFEQLQQQFETGLKRLNPDATGDAAVYRQAKAQAESYLAHSRKMYEDKQGLLQKRIAIASQYEAISLAGDEAGALVLDLTYLPGAESNPDVKRLAGAGTTVDNQLVPMLNVTKEYIAVTGRQASVGIKGDLEYAISNLETSVAYVERLAQDLDTDGIVDSFKDEFNKLKALYQDDDGLFALQAHRLSLQEGSDEQMRAAEASLAAAIDGFSTLFSRISEDTLKGQRGILEVVQSNIIKGIIITLISLGLVGLTAVLATRSIAKPLERIKRSLIVISKGDLTHRADDSSKDEFGLLASSVNELSESLHSVVGEILSKETQLEQATKQSVSLGDTTLSQVSRQRELVVGAAKNTDTVRRSSETNLNHIRQGMEQLKRVEGQAAEAHQMVIEAREQIMSQAEQSIESSNIIARLEENSRNIGGILDVIKTIAEQTNLLALNAAIEAARAGEQGRGFAVVADEVRTLANRTHQSTEEIERMISSLQSDAKQAVDAIQTGTTKSQGNVELIQIADKNVSEVIAIVQELSQINQRVVNESSEQDLLLQSAGDSLNQVVELAKSSASATERSKEAIKQVDSLMGELKQAVTRFTLS